MSTYYHIYNVVDDDYVKSSINYTRNEAHTLVEELVKLNEQNGAIYTIIKSKDVINI